jgi:hypothetical protein
MDASKMITRSSLYLTIFFSFLITSTIVFPVGFIQGKAEGATDAFRLINTNIAMVTLSTIELAKNGNASVVADRLDATIDEQIVTLYLLKEGSLWTKQEDLANVERALAALTKYRRTHPFTNLNSPPEVQQRVQDIVQNN